MSPIVVAVVVSATNWGGVGQRVEAETQKVAAALFGQFVLPFEIVSVLLLAAVIGGVFLARREEGRPL